MNLPQLLNQELQRLVGSVFSTPQTVSVDDGQGVRLTMEFTAIDSMSCAFLQIELFAPALSGAAFDVLKKWGEALSRRITYLLEQIAPLELDPQGGQVLIRSTPPDKLPDGTQYYEIQLSSQPGGNFTLRRYRSIKGVPGRDPVPITVTHQVLLKLVEDLVATLPSTP